MRMVGRVLTFACAAVVATFPSVARAETLVLSKQFVQRVKDLATIPAALEVDTHPKTPHAIKQGGDDGDIHMAGRANEIKLPLVAEIVNARLEPDALELLNRTKPGQLVAVTGVWRIWFEHLGKTDQIQGDDVPIPTTSNPDHLFELHPLTSFGGIDLGGSFVPIQNYTAYDGATAFGFYEHDAATLQANASAILITASEGKYNYTEFLLEVAGPITATADGGRMVLANVYSSQDAETRLSAAPRRMVFAPAGKSPDAPAAQLQGLGVGDRLHVLGIPRVSLAEVSVLVDGKTGAKVSVNLPYEMIVVAILPD